MFTVFTDGFYDYLTDVGSYAYAIIDNENKTLKIFARRISKTTNNRMELLGITTAIEMLQEKIKQGTEVKIFSDSQYCVGIFSKWAENWRKKNYTKNKGEFKNLDIIVPCFEQNRLHSNLSFHWVRGHVGIYGNEFVDDLCNQAKDLDVVIDQTRPLSDDELNEFLNIEPSIKELARATVIPKSIVRQTEFKVTQLRPAKARNSYPLNYTVRGKPKRLKAEPSSLETRTVVIRRTPKKEMSN